MKYYRYLESVICVKDDTNYTGGEYMYYNQKWLLIQEITPVK